MAANSKKLERKKKKKVLGSHFNKESQIKANLAEFLALTPVYGVRRQAGIVVLGILWGERRVWDFRN